MLDTVTKIKGKGKVLINLIKLALVDLPVIKSMENIAMHSPVAPIRPNGFGRSTSSQRIYLNGKIKESLMRSESQPSFCASNPRTKEEPKNHKKRELEISMST